MTRSSTRNRKAVFTLGDSLELWLHCDRGRKKTLHVSFTSLKKAFATDSLFFPQEKMPSLLTWCTYFLGCGVSLSSVTSSVSVRPPQGYLVASCVPPSYCELILPDWGQMLHSLRTLKHLLGSVLHFCLIVFGWHDTLCRTWISGE